MSNITVKGPMRCAALAACAGLAVAVCAFAGDAPGPDPRTLGIAESMLSYCAKVDRDTAAGYREKIKHLVQSASEETLAKVRSSSEYLQARASIEDFVAKVDEHNAKRMCTNGLGVRRRSNATLVAGPHA
jgi:hypothetical protein